MATTHHGHYIPYSEKTQHDDRAVRFAKPCGGIDSCSDCKIESDEWQRDHLKERLEEGDMVTGDGTVISMSDYRVVVPEVEDSKMRHPSTIYARQAERMSEDVKEALSETQKPNDAVNHPSYYGGADNPYEVIKVIEAWDLDFHLGTAVKYIPRAGKKDPELEIQDLEKSVFYINRKIELLRERVKNG